MKDYLYAEFPGNEWQGAAVSVMLDPFLCGLAAQFAGGLAEHKLLLENTIELQKPLSKTNGYGTRGVAFISFGGLQKGIGEDLPPDLLLSSHDAVPKARLLSSANTQPQMPIQSRCAALRANDTPIFWISSSELLSKKNAVLDKSAICTKNGKCQQKNG